MGIKVMESRKLPKGPRHFLNINQQPIVIMDNYMQSPKISINAQNEHQESHPMPHKKYRLNKSKSIRYKNNIDNITKQMLAGSNVQRIANQLHNVQSIKMEQQQNKIANVQILKLTKKEEIEIESENENDDDFEDEKEESLRFEDEKEEKFEPYLPAVLEIKKMPQFEPPEDKIQCVVRTADIIRECIDKFYENRRKDPIQITPDDLLSLFAYILTRANLHCLWAEVDLIDDFVVDNLRMDMPGYYIATLRAAMQLIVNDIDKLTQTSLKKRSLKISVIQR